MTLYEAIVYVTIVAFIGTPIVSVVLASTRMISEVDATGKVQERNRAVIYRIEKDLRSAIGTTVVVSNFNRTIRFTLATGYDGNAIVAGPDIEYAFELDSGETWNWVDDDGDGLIDDAVLYRRDLTTNEEVILCDGINYSQSLFVSWSGDVWLVLTNTSAVDRSEKTVDIYNYARIHSYN